MGSQIADGPGELPPIDMSGCYGDVAYPTGEMYVVNRDDSNGPGGNAPTPSLGQGPGVEMIATSDHDSDDRY